MSKVNDDDDDDDDDLGTLSVFSLSTNFRLTDWTTELCSGAIFVTWSSWSAATAGQHADEVIRPVLRPDYDRSLYFTSQNSISTGEPIKPPAPPQFL